MGLVAVLVGACGARTKRLTASAAPIALALLLAGCTGTGVIGTTYQNHVFKIVATSGYSWQMVEDTGTTSGTGSANMSFTITAATGQQYTLTAWKSAADGQPLEVELVADETVNGVPTSVVVDSQTTTSTNTPARVTLYE